MFDVPHTMYWSDGVKGQGEGEVVCMGSPWKCGVVLILQLRSELGCSFREAKEFAG